MKSDGCEATFATAFREARTACMFSSLDELSRSMSIPDERLAAFETGEARPSTVEFMACFAALDTCWTAAPVDWTAPVALAATGSRRPRREVLKALEKVLKDLDDGVALTAGST